MAYQDVCPERRNLMLTSVAFIIYKLGHGTVYQSNNEVISLRLAPINIELQNIELISIFPYLFLFFFAYRFYVTQKQPLRRQFEKDLNELCSGKVLRCFFKAFYKRDIKEDSVHGAHILDIEAYVSGDGKVYSVRISNSGTIHPENPFRREVKNGNKNDEERIEIGEKLLWAPWFIYSLCTPSFSSYIFPYIILFSSVICIIIY